MLWQVSGVFFLLYLLKSSSWVVVAQQQEEITFDVVVELSEEDLVRLGIAEFGKRKKLLVGTHLSTPPLLFLLVLHFTHVSILILHCIVWLLVGWW